MALLLSPHRRSSLTEWASWPGVFYITIAIALAVLASLRAGRNTRRARTSARNDRP
ncbi:hypothetical protein [Baekduia alba]|uniref:hypothetical protein n=1 Tax=Baekduia alba TaxID=2997333 RepID=UPI0023410840|nr:hypothetical protein [Baekduia alba]